MFGIAEKNQSARVSGLDFLRCGALFLVLLSHFPRVDGVSFFGWFGTHAPNQSINIFFILSGYLIAQDIFKDLNVGRFSLRNFYARRVLRTFPNYLAVVGIYLAFPFLNEHAERIKIWRYLTFTQNFDYDLYQMPFAPSWSLCIEEHFYLLLPLLVLGFYRELTPRKVILVVVFVLVSGVLLRSTLWYEYVSPRSSDMIPVYFYRIHYPTWTQLDALMLGVALAYLKTNSSIWEKLLSSGNYLLFSGFALCLLASLLVPLRYELIYSIANIPIGALGSCLLALAALSPQSWLGKMHVPGLRYVADFSYSVYVVHYAVFYAVMRFMKERNLNFQSWGGVALSFTVTGLAALTIFYGVERPFMRLRARYFEKK